MVLLLILVISGFPSYFLVASEIWFSHLYITDVYYHCNCIVEYISYSLLIIREL